MAEPIEAVPATVVSGLPPRGSRARRSMGMVLAIFGAVGIALLGGSLLVVVGPVDADEGPFGLEGQRRQIVRLLDATETAIDDAETAVRSADDSLGQTADAAASAGGFMTELATTMRAASGTLRLSVFGTQPFVPVAEDFERVAGQAEAVAADLQATAGSVDDASADLATLAADLAEMRAEMATIRSGISGQIETDSWRLVIGALLGWLVIPALVSLLLGLRWLRPAPRSTIPPAPGRRASVPARRVEPDPPSTGS